MNKKVTIIGSGPAGYACAIKCAQLGFETTCIENTAVGGTCLNVGCIPSKALLHGSLKYFEGYKTTFDKIQKEKEQAVSTNSQGIVYLFKKNGVNHINGTASFNKDKKVVVNGKVIDSDYIVIASGSSPKKFMNIDFNDVIISSTEALSLKSLPKSMIVVGGGVIGLEIGSVYARMGVKVTVIEYSKTFLPFEEPEVHKEVMALLKEAKVEIKTGCSVSKIESKNGKAVVKTDQGEFTADYALVSVGRKPNISSLNLSEANINIDDRDHIIVNDNYETNVKNIFAIGDVIKGSMLAHRGYQDANVLSHYLKTGKKLPRTEVPGVVYTEPEIASVGMKTVDAEAKYGKENIGTSISSFTANPRARVMHRAKGFLKVVFHKKNKKILGATIVGAEAGNMIHEFCVIIAFGGSMRDMELINHAHPTLNEIIVEACAEHPLH